MKLLSLSFAILMLASVSASSQVISFGLGANLTFPSAELKDNVATGYGGTALAKFGLLPLVDLTGGIEYVKFTDKDITVGTITESGTGSAFGNPGGWPDEPICHRVYRRRDGHLFFHKKSRGKRERLHQRVLRTDDRCQLHNVRSGGEVRFGGR